MLSVCGIHCDIMKKKIEKVHTELNILAICRFRYGNMFANVDIQAETVYKHYLLVIETNERFGICI